MQYTDGYNGCRGRSPGANQQSMAAAQSAAMGCGAEEAWSLESLVERWFYYVWSRCPLIIATECGGWVRNLRTVKPIKLEVLSEGRATTTWHGHKRRVCFVRRIAQRRRNWSTEGDTREQKAQQWPQCQPKIGTKLSCHKLMVQVHLQVRMSRSRWWTETETASRNLRMVGIGVGVDVALHFYGGGGCRLRNAQAGRPTTIHQAR